MPNPFRKTTTAVTSRGNPFRTSTADTAIRDSALSPLMEETPFTSGRPSLPVGGPRASRPLPAVVTTAESPKEFERRLARAIQAGTKRTEPFGGEGELTEAQRMQLERARGAVTVAEDIGKAVAGQPSRTLMRTATGIAQLRGDPRAQRLLEQTRALEAETAPQTGIGAVARVGSEIGAFIPSGLTMGALRSGLESAAGEEFSTAGMLAQMTGREAPKSALGRALADAALDLSLPGLLAARRGVRGVREAQRGIGEAFTQGLREGAGEAAEAATPSLARGDGYRPRTMPETDPSRLIPSTTSRTFATGEPIPMRGEVPVQLRPQADVTARLAELAQEAQQARQAVAAGIEVVPALEPRTAQRQRKLRREMAESKQQLQADIDDRRALAMPDFEATSQLEAMAEVGRRERALQPESPILRSRTGAIDPALLSQIATTGLGAIGGAAVGAQQEEMGGTALQRALSGAVAGGALGAGVKAGASRLMRKMAPPTTRGSTPALQFINEGINVGRREVQEADRLLSKFERFRSQLVSETLPLEKAAETAGGAAARKNVTEMIAQQQGAGQSAKQYLRDRIAPVVEGLTDAELDDARALLKARRLLNIVEKGGAAKGAGDPTIWRQAIADAETNPRVKAAADAVNDMHRDLLEKRYKAGLLSAEDYQNILRSDDFYTPFVREIAEDVAGGAKLTIPGSQTGRFNVFSKGIRKMDRDVEVLANTADPFEVATIAAARAFRDTRKQQVITSLLEMVDAGALPFVRQVQADPTKPLAANQFKQIRDGKMRVYAVDDPDMFRAIAGQDTQTDFIGKSLLQSMKNIKTGGITLNPVFAMKNVIRDVALSGIQRPDLARGLGEAAGGAAIGGVGGAALGEDRDLEGMVKNFARGAGIGAGAGLYARPLAQTLKAVGDMALGDKDLFRRFFSDEDYKEFLRQGGSTEGFYVRSPDDAQRVLRELRNQKVDLSTIVNPRSWVDALRFIGSVGEQSTRLAAYRQAIQAGKTPLEAIVDAQDRTLRFANVGAKTKPLAAVVPFWNAKVQGWDKLIRMLGNPKTYAAGFTAITAPTIALWSINKDNPDYWKRPQWERDLFWLVPMPDSNDFFRVPKPFEIGYLFSSMFERGLDYASQRGLIPSAAPQTAEPGRTLARSAASMATGSLEGTLPAPPILDIPLQIAANYDVFRDRSIVSRPDLPEELQGGRNVSALARTLAKAGVSPEKTDFVVRELFGTAGEEGLRLSTAAARAAGMDIPESDQPAAISGLFERAFVTQDRGQTESEIAARERLTRLATVQAGYNELKKRGDREATVTYAQENLMDLDLYNELKPLQRYIDEQTARRRQVERSSKYSKEDREALIALYRDRVEEASRAIIEKGRNAP